LTHFGEFDPFLTILTHFGDTNWRFSFLKTMVGLLYQHIQLHFELKNANISAKIFSKPITLAPVVNVLINFYSYYF
jgi:hypothetical protein